MTTEPFNPIHAMALLVRDGALKTDDETAETLAKALEIHEAQQSRSGRRERA